MVRLLLLLLLASLCASPVQAQPPEAAVLAYAEGRYEQALALLPENAEVPDNAECHMLRADCLQKLGDAGLALDYYDRARILGYHKDDLYLNRGICKTTLGMHDEARTDLAQYIEHNPNDAKGYYWMGTVEYYNMDNKASIRYLNEAIWYDSLYAAAYFLRGANYVEQGKSLLALEDFDLAYKTDPTLYRAKLNTAILMLDMQSYRGALEMFSELSLENLDITAEALYYRGETNFRLHDTEGACIDWSESASLGDIDAAENFRRLCLDRSGKPKFKRRTYGEF